METQRIDLGREVKCKVTNFKGIATSRVEYLNGCFRVAVQPPIDKDGKFIDALFIDEPQLEYTEETKQIPASSKFTGGPSTSSAMKGTSL